MAHDDLAPVPYDPAQICERIDEMRRALRWSWGDLAMKSGVNEMTIRRWRTGAPPPSNAEVRLTAEAMGLVYEEITFGLNPRLNPRHDDAPESEPPRSRHAA
jgi:transcriptional regulator with XRE-family HTH domain